MSVESHIRSLELKHAELEAILTEEMARPSSDFYKIKETKKEKLMIKEEIARLMHDMAVHKHGTAS